MTIEKVLSQLKDKGSVNFHEPLSFNEIKKLLAKRKLTLSSEHLDLLKNADGLECFGGYFRLFGLDQRKRINLFSWNSMDLWKFAWGGKLDGYLCFGETAWGDQYAYRLNSAGTIEDSKIYFIEGLTMVPEVIKDNFEAFLSEEIVKNATKPYDEFIVEVRNRLGNLSIDEQITYIPSPLIGGVEDPANAQKIDAVASMVINGDLCLQLADQSRERPIKELQRYIDKTGRHRLKVIWLDN